MSTWPIRKPGGTQWDRDPCGHAAPRPIRGFRGLPSEERNVRALLVIACLIVTLQAVHAQDIYKWEDEKGIIHYGDKPPQPGATPFIKDTAPFSTPGGRPGASRGEEPPVSPHGRRGRTQRPTLPSPSLRQSKAWIDHPNGDFWISGTMHNGGRGLCDAPAVEVAVIDELGSVNGRFEVAATPPGIGKGEDAQFSGKSFAPVGDKLSWEATPRCGSTIGAIYGARKRGSLHITHSRRVPSKRLKTYR